MTKTADIYCSRCQCQVRPIKSLVNYCCPKCGAIFMASQVVPEPKNGEPDEDPQPMAVSG